MNTKTIKQYAAAIANAKSDENVVLGSSGWSDPVSIDTSTRDMSKMPAQSYLISANNEVMQVYHNAIDNAERKGAESVGFTWYVNSDGDIVTHKHYDMSSESFDITQTNSLEKILK